jgi:hypothetical protein
MARWPEGLDDSMGATTTRLYLTPAEADQLYCEIHQAFQRLLGPKNQFRERRDPALRPADAIPIEYVLMGYPILDLPRSQTPKHLTRVVRRTAMALRDVAAECQTPNTHKDRTRTVLSSTALPAVAAISTPSATGPDTSRVHRQLISVRAPDSTSPSEKPLAPKTV